MPDERKDEPLTGWRAVFARATELVAKRATSNNTAWDENIARLMAREYEIRNALPASDRDRASVLQTALQAAFGATDREVCLVDVYTEQKAVIFYYHTPVGPQPPGYEYFRSYYTEGENGALTFSEPERVRRMTSYEPAAPGATTVTYSAQSGTATQQTEETAMQENEKKELVAELTTQFTKLLEPVTTKIAEIETAATGIGGAAQEAVNAAVEKFDAALKAMGEKVDAVNSIVTKGRDEERQALVEALSSNSRTPFTQAELEAKPLDELKKIAQIAQVDTTNYAGRGGPRAAANAEAEAAFLEPVPYFAANKKDEVQGATKEDK